jgi:hypothetical protein
VLTDGKQKPARSRSTATGTNLTFVVVVYNAAVADFRLLGIESPRALHMRMLVILRVPTFAENWMEFEPHLGN